MQVVELDERAGRASAVLEAVRTAGSGMTVRISDARRVLGESGTAELARRTARGDYQCQLVVNDVVWSPQRAAQIARVLGEHELDRWRRNITALGSDKSWLDNERNADIKCIMCGRPGMHLRMKPNRQTGERGVQWTCILGDDGWYRDEPIAAKRERETAERRAERMEFNLRRKSGLRPLPGKETAERARAIMRRLDAKAKRERDKQRTKEERAREERASKRYRMEVAASRRLGLQDRGLPNLHFVCKPKQPAKKRAGGGHKRRRKQASGSDDEAEDPDAVALEDYNDDVDREGDAIPVRQSKAPRLAMQENIEKVIASLFSSSSSSDHDEKQEEELESEEERDGSGCSGRAGDAADGAGGSLGSSDGASDGLASEEVDDSEDGEGEHEAADGD
jgi:hypothetical protein